MHITVENIIILLQLSELFIGFILVLAMFFQYYRNTRVLSTLELGFIILILGSILNFVLPELIQNSLFLAIFEISAVFLWIIAPLAIYYHYEQRNRNEPSYPLVLTLIGLAILSATLSIISLTLPELPDLQSYRMFLEIIAINTSELISILVFGFAFYTNYKALNFSDETGVKFELVGTGFISVGFLIIVSLRSFAYFFGIPDPIASEVMSHDFQTILLLILILAFFFLVNIGILLFLINIIIHPNFAYNLPIPIVNFMIYNESGVAVYSKFTEISKIDISFEEQLLSGALKAVSALIEETLGTDASLDHFDAGKFQIFFHQIKSSSSMLVVISMGASPFIKRSMRKFANGLNDKTSNKLNSSNISDDLVDEIDKNLKVAFPYINLD